MNELLRRILFLPRQESTVARMVDTLHYIVIGSTTGGAFLVTCIGLYFLVKYRRRRFDDGAARPEAFAAPPFWFEIAAIASLFGLFIAFWLIGVGQYARLRVPPPGAMPVYVVAKQWMWTFAYPEGAKSLEVLYVPTGRPIKLVISSRDVIHSFYVPDFRIKQDAVPGRITTAWFEAVRPGRYQILCAEYCGTSHSTMRGEVMALEPQDYQRWLAGEPTPSAVRPPIYEPPAVVQEDEPRGPLDLVRQGEISAARHGCLRCHSVDGTPHIGPTWAGLYRAVVPLEAGGTVVADDAYITESMMDPAVKVHRGYRPVMPSFLGLLEAPETAAILQYIQSLRDVPVSPGSGGVREPPGSEAHPKAPAIPGSPPPRWPAPPDEQGKPPQ